MHFTTRSFLGHTDPNSWSQFWENEPDDPQIISTRGHLFGLVNLSLIADEDASALGHDLINQLNAEYFSPSEINVKDWLIHSVEFIADNYLPQCSQLTILIAVCLNQQLYLISYNSGQMIYHRSSQISTILKSLSGKTSAMVGQVQDDDQLLLTTYPFSQGYTWEKIKNYLSLIKVQDIEENFLSQLYNLPDQSHLAGALIIFHNSTPSPQVAVPIPPPPTIIKNIPTAHPTYIPHIEPTNISRRRRLNIIFSLIVLIVLGISIYIGSQRNLKSQTESKYQSLKTEFNSKITAASAIKNISLTDAQKLAHDADSIIDKMSVLKIHQDEITQLQNSTHQLLSQTGSSDTYQPLKFFDTSLIYSDAKYIQLSIFKNNLYLFDSQNGRVDKVDITNKSKQNISSDTNLKNTQNMAINDDVVYLQKDLQIYQLDSKSFVSKIKIPSAGQFNFWNGSLYLLNDSIWKFTPNSTGFDSGAVWLKTNEKLPSNPTSLAINGQIWVISNTGELVPYTHGARTDFKLKTNTSFTKVANLVTGPNSDYLAFTDADNLVYVYKKNGESVSNYNFGSKKILSLALDQTTNTIFVLCSDAQIYKITL